MKTGDIKVVGNTLGLPNKTTVEMNAISAPVAGMLIWNTTETAIYAYDGSTWVRATTDESNLVHRTGDEDIGGAKVFTDMIVSSNDVYVGDPRVSVNNRSELEKTGVSIFGDTTEYTGYNKDGISYNDGTTLRTFSLDSDYGGTIATESWVNTPGSTANVVHRTGTETIGGAKTFTSGVLGPYFRASQGAGTATLNADGNSQEVTLLDTNGSLVEMQNSQTATWVKLYGIAGSDNYVNVGNLSLGTNNIRIQANDTLNKSQIEVWSGVTNNMQITATDIKKNGVSVLGSSYNHTQGVADVTWLVTHSLGYFPVVMAWDSSNAQILGTVQNLSTSQLTITFATSQSGKARCV